MGIRTSTCSEAQLLDQYVNTSYEVIKKAVDNLNTITLLGDLNNDSESVKFLQRLLDDIDEITNVVNSVDLIEAVSTDINKSTYLGHRKLDIDLSLNKQGITRDSTATEALSIWQNTDNTVYYSSAIATMSNGAVINIPFINADDDPTLESTHSGILNQLDDNATFQAALENTNIIVEIGGKVGSIIRISDVTGQVSNLDRLELITNTGDYVDTSPVYYWVDTTSVLQVLGTRIEEILVVGENLLAIENVALYASEIVALYDNLSELQNIHTNLAEILTADDSATAAEEFKDIASSAATVASNYAALAEASALAAEVNKIEWQGVWNSGTTYQVHDAVYSSGSSYICLQTNTNAVPTVGGDANWDELALKGADGGGSGDVVSTNNLTDLDNLATALSNLGGEPAFTKNTAFNEDFTASGGDNGTATTVARGDHVHSQYHTDSDFGTTSGTVAEGNHVHLGVYEPEGNSTAMAIALGG